MKSLLLFAGIFLLEIFNQKCIGSPNEQKEEEYVPLFVGPQTKMAILPDFEKSFESIGLLIFDEENLSNSKSRQEIQHVLSTVDEDYFHKFLDLLQFDIIGKSECLLSLFQQSFLFIIENTFISETNGEEIFSKFHRSLIRFFKKKIGIKHGQLSAVCYAFRSSFYSNKKFRTDFEYQFDVELELNFILLFFEEYYIKFVKNGNHGSDTLQSVDDSTQEILHSFLIDFSKKRRIKLIKAFLENFENNFEDLIKKLNKELVERGMNEMDVFQEIAFDLEFRVLALVLKDDISQCSDIFIIKNPHEMIEGYFLRRKSFQSYSEYWFMWRQLIGRNCSDPKYLREFVENCSKLKLSQNAWRSVAKLIVAFCAKNSTDLESIFNPTFLIVYCNEEIDVIYFLRKFVFLNGLGISEETYLSSDAQASNYVTQTTAGQSPNPILSSSPDESKDLTNESNVNLKSILRKTSITQDLDKLRINSDDKIMSPPSQSRGIINSSSANVHDRRILQKKKSLLKRRVHFVQKDGAKEKV